VVVVAVLLIALLVLTAGLGALSLRLEDTVLTILAGYVVIVAEVIVLTTVLSPFGWVTREGLAAGQLVLAGAATAAWLARGRPVPRVGSAWRGLVEALRDPVVAALGLVVALVLGYELLLALTAAPNNWDSLTYHLSRTAAWLRHGGLYWVPNAPTGRINEFQTGAEQQLLFLCAVTGRGALYAFPQLVAQVVIVAAIPKVARQLGYGRGASLASGLLFGSFTLVALEATTSQNDLVAAAFPVVAAAFILRGRTIDLWLAGAAVGLGLGVKLTTALVLPVLVALALLAGRRAFARFALATIVGFLLLGSAGYLRNLEQTGRLLGDGDGRVQHAASPSFGGAVSTSFRAAYRLLDLSGYGNVMITLLALGAVAFIGVCFPLVHRDGAIDRSAAKGVAIGAVALLSPLLVLAGAAIAEWAAKLVGLPVADPDTTSVEFSWKVGRLATEDYSAFGPLAAVLLFGVVSGGLYASLRARADPRRLVLALTLPCFIVLLALTAKYNPWLSRFVIVPVALTMPLCAAVFRWRTAGAAILVVAAVTVGAAHVRNYLKPVSGGAARPWQLDQVAALSYRFPPELGPALAELDRRVPAAERIGALMDDNDPTYLLYGPQLGRTVTYLPVPNESAVLDREGIDTVVIHAGDFSDPQARLRAAGWALEPLGDYWVLATRR